MTEQGTWAIGAIATVLVDGWRYTGTIYHVRENGWPCVRTPEGVCASGPTTTRV